MNHFIIFMITFNSFAASCRRGALDGRRRTIIYSINIMHLKNKVGGCSFIIGKSSHDVCLFPMASSSVRILSSLITSTLTASSSSSSSSALSSSDDSFYLAPTLASVQEESLRGGKKKRAAKKDFASIDDPTTSTTHPPDDANDQRPHSSIYIDGLAAGEIGFDPRGNTRHAPMVYHERYSCPNWPSKHTFPMAKFEHTALSLLNDTDEFLDDVDDDDDATVAADADGGSGRRLVLSRDHFYRPLPMEAFPRSFLCPPIRSDFIENFVSGSLSPEDRRIIGFRDQTSRPELIERTVLEVAGTVLTAQLAMRYGLASNLAGGTHHADSLGGRGFTIINDLAVTARLMTWREGDVVADEESSRTSMHETVGLMREFYRGHHRGVVDRVLVVDCDVHQGDGTATFSYPPTTSADDVVACRHEKNSLHGRLFTLDLHASNNYPHPKESCTYDIGLLDGCDDDTYLSELERSLDRALREVRPQLVLYNAGVDVFESDKLGRLSLSYEGMRRRDTHVIRTCVDRGIPVAAVVGGGYDNDVSVLGKRHALVHRVCAQIWRERRLWERNFDEA